MNELEQLASDGVSDETGFTVVILLSVLGLAVGGYILLKLIGAGERVATEAFK